MKRKAFLYTLALTTMLFSGCARNNTNGVQNSPVTQSSDYSSGQTVNSSVPGHAAASSSQNNQTAAPSGQTTPSGSQTAQNEQTMITEEKAKEIALNHAGLTIEQVTFTQINLDRENGSAHYDVEFHDHEQKEHDYEIDCYTGAVLEWDVEPVHDTTR